MRFSFEKYLKSAVDISHNLIFTRWKNIDSEDIIPFIVTSLEEFLSLHIQTVCFHKLLLNYLTETITYMADRFSSWMLVQLPLLLRLQLRRGTLTSLTIFSLKHNTISSLQVSLHNKIKLHNTHISDGGTWQNHKVRYWRSKHVLARISA